MILARIVAGIGEGRFGAGPKRLYWWLVGRKTAIAMVIAFVAGIVETADRTGVCARWGLDCAGYSAGLAGLAGALAAIGLYDGALRTPPPHAPGGAA